MALLDAARLNASTQAFIQVSLANTSTSKLREFNQRMRELEEVVGCHMVAGGIRLPPADPLRRHAGLPALPG